MVRMLLPRPLPALVPALLAAVILAACGGEQPTGKAAAKVNGEIITVQQVDHELARLRGLNEEQKKGAARQVLDRLVDQELLAQRARARGVDRDPRVVQAIESSRRQILAQAYLEAVGAGAVRPTPEEVKQFYAAHPELFAERKLYRLQELAIGARAGLTTERLEAELKQAGSLNDVVAWLKREQIPFNASSTVKAAEQLPMEVVPRIAALEVGQAMLMPAKQGYLIVQIGAIERQPLDEAQAQPFIEQYLANQKRAELARSEVKSLKASAKVEYADEYANAPPADDSARAAIGPGGRAME